MSEDDADVGSAAAPSPEDPGLGLAGGGMSSDANASYRVLARKYRPSNFDELIGQEAMVRTLRNAFEARRIAHGFILTGVRGIGKTTTARIIAKGLNCMGANGTDRNDGEPTVSPCGVCPNCQAISESRHVDVLEMDAASRTGIDDIREIIEGVRYAPVSARYKVYIIDEVHMLSKAAFNGLLKTLEEPPPHVKFIFATTEIRKVPVTVLSRCQRFDLRRIQSDEMVAHLQSVAAAEGMTVELGALRLIVRAAEGSARDALSLLDQAISHGAGQNIEEVAVRDMLGLVDRGRIFDLYASLMSGDIASALDQLRDLHIGGGDPITILQDLLEVTHWITRLKVSKAAADSAMATEEEVVQGEKFAAELPMNVLTRTWSMLLKGLSEVQSAPQTLSATEMVLIRLAYVADLPSPEELVRTLSNGVSSDGTARQPAPAPTQSGGPAASNTTVHTAGVPAPQGREAQAGQSVSRSVPVAQAQPQQEALHHPPIFTSFEAIVLKASDAREISLKTQMEDCVHLVRFEPGRIEFRPTEGAPADLSSRLAAKLQDWTNTRWVVTVSNAAGEPTLSQQKEAEEQRRHETVSKDPLVMAFFETFPKARIAAIRDPIVDAPDEGGLGIDDDLDLEDSDL